ncbi:MAG: type II toxin-antitoxin system VapB family antitoxin [Actinomycetota bacterium]
MRTTLNLNPDLIRAAKEAAVRTQRTLTAVIEDALRHSLLSGSTPESQPVDLVVSPGRLLPGIDLDDSASLIDLMEGDVSS